LASTRERPEMMWYWRAPRSSARAISRSKNDSRAERRSRCAPSAPGSTSARGISQKALPQPLEMDLEGARLDLDMRHLPDALAEGRRRAEEHRHRPAAGEPGDAVLGVGLPEPVGRELGEHAKATFALLQLADGAVLAARDVHHREVDQRAGDQDQRQEVGH